MVRCYAGDTFESILSNINGRLDSLEMGMGYERTLMDYDEAIEYDSHHEPTKYCTRCVMMRSMTRAHEIILEFPSIYIDWKLGHMSRISFNS